MILHTKFQRRLLIEEFTRLRPANEIRRFAASQRRGRVDANPHQIDAVAFALERIPEGGCILADEVGLGKTIEAGLIVSQLFAEGMSRVLLIVPKALMGQWQTEMRSLFGLEVKIGAPTPDAFTGEGIFIVNREFAGGIKGAPLLSSSDPFDLAIIDEAHELFAGIHKRFDKKSGQYLVDQKHAQISHRVYNLLHDRETPALLLTATPIQNNLDEIWGLVQYIERNNRLLGDLPTFRQRFSLPSTDEDGLSQSLALDLRNRLQTVVQRTLRKQAQPFLDTPFVERHAKTVEYQLTTEERQLYNDITEWLMRPDLLSYSTTTRRLLVVGFHRRMASSFAALKSSLINVANRLRKELDNTGGNAWTDAIAEFAADLEEANEELELLPENDDDHLHNDEREQPRDPAQIKQELKLLENFVERAEALKGDSKAQCLLSTLAVISEQEMLNNGTGKAVIFTESIETQNYLTDYLIRNGFATSDITLFRGDNSHPRAQEALVNWRDEVAANLPTSHVPPPDVAVRLALVHEFKTRSKLLIATEAGAKGLNLQFCESLINYDLPWNPQRIEQRIGRVHRYGQTRGVFVFNLVDRGNEAANLTYDILSRKLDLFGKVLDASDDVLHTPDHTFPESLVSGIGIDFEKQVRQVYQQSSSIEDVIAQLRSLRETIDQQRQEFDETQERCAEVIESRLDDSVATIFRNHQTQLPEYLAKIDRETDIILESYLHTIGCGYTRTQSNETTRYVADSNPHLPDGFQNGVEFVIGEVADNESGEQLFQDHPVLKSAFNHARQNSTGKECVELASDGNDRLANFIGKRGRLRGTKLRYHGLVNVEHLLVTLLLEDSDDPIENITVADLLAITAKECTPFEVEIDDDLMDDCVEETAFDDKHCISQQEQQVFDTRLRQLDQYLQDRRQVVNERLLLLGRQLSEIQKKRNAASAPTTLEKLQAEEKKLRKELGRQQTQLDALLNNQDPNYQNWKNALMDRRKTPPEQTTLLDANFKVVGL